MLTSCNKTGVSLNDTSWKDLTLLTSSPDENWYRSLSYQVTYTKYKYIHTDLPYLSLCVFSFLFNLTYSFLTIIAQ